MADILLLIFTIRKPETNNQVTRSIFYLRFSLIPTEDNYAATILYQENQPISEHCPNI